MARPVKFFRCRESADSFVRAEAANAIGARQASFAILATTKAEASRIAERTVGSYPARALDECSGDDFTALRLAKIITGYVGTVVAWSHRSDSDIIRWGHDDGPDDFTTVATWRWNAARNGIVPVLPAVDPLLRPTREVMVPGVLSVDKLGKHYGGDRSNYPGNVATYSGKPDVVWVPGIGNVDRTRAEELLTGLVGALADLDARTVSVELDTL